MRLVLLTADGARHRTVAARLGAETELAGVLVEAKAPLVPQAERLDPADQVLIARHFAERDEVEHRLLGDPDFPRLKVMRVPAGAVNSPAVAAWVAERRPDMIVLFGTSIVREPLLDRYGGRIVNMHLGLSPYYRGCGTNFWPLVQGRPECVGVTVHLAVPKVDAGAILAQIRPHVGEADRIHEAGTKALLAALGVLPGVLQAYCRGTLEPRPQDLSSGNVYRARDFTADAVRRAWRNLDADMMGDYLRAAPVRRAAYPIVEWVP